VLGFGDEAAAVKMPSRVTNRVGMSARDKRARSDVINDPLLKRQRALDGTAITNDNDAATATSSTASSTTPSSLAHLPAGQTPSSEAAAMPMMDPTDPAFNHLLGMLLPFV
jgi:hypothetical protein